MFSEQHFFNSIDRIATKIAIKAGSRVISENDLKAQKIVDIDQYARILNKTIPAVVAEL